MTVPTMNEKLIQDLIDFILKTTKILQKQQLINDKANATTEKITELIEKQNRINDQTFEILKTLEMLKRNES